MSLANELLNFDATAQAELVLKKEVQPIELVETVIERIEKINPEINAVVTNMYDEACAAAKVEPKTAPFAGVPFLLKDILAAYKGVPTTSGSKYLKNLKPDQDSELVARHKRAGLIIVGKTNTPEFGILPTTEPELFGAARNPWNTEHTTGGSSGGSAAAVAAGIVPMAHANDGGGSIRIPSSCCGVFGLKPTRARNPLGPNFGDIYSGLVVEHAVSRTVRDSTLLLDATSGNMLGDPYYVPAPTRPFIEEVGADTGKLRIAFFTEAPLGTPIHKDCVAAVEDAVKLLVDLGHEVVNVAPAIDGEMMWKSFMAIWAAGVSWSIQNMSLATGRMPAEGELELGTVALNEIGKKVSASEYLLSVQYLQALTRQIAEFMKDYDLLLTPTLGSPPLKLGAFAPTPEDPMAGMHVATEFVPFTPICNATGQPAMSVPLYWNAAGLPIGTHFIGRYGDEATLFRLASQLEQARPWAHRRPPVSA